MVAVRLDRAQQACRQQCSVTGEEWKPEGDDSTPVAFLAASGLVASRGEARRLITQNALSVDDSLNTDAATPLKKGQYVIKLGKKRFLRLSVE